MNLLRRCSEHPLPSGLLAAALIHAAVLAGLASLPTQGERLLAWSGKPNYTYYARAAAPATQARPG